MKRTSFFANECSGKFGGVCHESLLVISLTLLVTIAVFAEGYGRYAGVGGYGHRPPVTTRGPISLHELFVKAQPLRAYYKHMRTWAKEMFGNELLANRDYFRVRPGQQGPLKPRYQEFPQRHEDIIQRENELLSYCYGRHLGKQVGRAIRGYMRHPQTGQMLEDPGTAKLSLLRPTDLVRLRKVSLLFNPNDPDLLIRKALYLRGCTVYGIDGSVQRAGNDTNTTTAAPPVSRTTPLHRFFNEEETSPRPAPAVREKRWIPPQIHPFTKVNLLPALFPPTSMYPTAAPSRRDWYHLRGATVSFGRINPFTPSEWLDRERQAAFAVLPLPTETPPFHNPFARPLFRGLDKRLDLN